MIPTIQQVSEAQGKCPECGGSKYVRPGIINNEVEFICPRCHGTGNGPIITTEVLDIPQWYGEYLVDGKSIQDEICPDMPEEMIAASYAEFAKERELAIFTKYIPIPHKVGDIEEVAAPCPTCKGTFKIKCEVLDVDGNILTTTWRQM